MPKCRPSSYDVVLLGTPIWMGRIAAPVREYLHTQSFGHARLGLFSTSAGPVASRLHLITRETLELGRILGFLKPLTLAVAAPPPALSVVASASRAEIVT